MANHIHDSNDSNFEITSKRRKGFPSETQVKRGVRVVHGNKELSEKLGRNDLCPCASGRRFQAVLYEDGPIRRHAPQSLHARVECNSRDGARRINTRKRAPALRCPPA